MPATEFLNRVASRINKIDRKNLEDYALNLAAQNHFLTTFLDQVDEGIMVLNAKKEIQFINRRMTQLLNLPESASRRGSLSHAISDEPFASLISNAIDQKRELYDQQFEVFLPRPMILKVRLVFFVEPPGATQALLTISNLGHAELNIRERFKMENWETMLGLAAGIAHEIGNPLNSLAIHLKLLEKSADKLPARERKDVEHSIRIMGDETKRLDGIVRSFLKATRRKPLCFELGNMNDLLSKSISLMSPELREAKIRVREDLDKRMPHFLFDQERLQQVFINILKNAVHAMPKGGTLRTQTETKGKLCYIHFHDSGVGIPEHAIHRIFDAYYTTKDEGSGLGLMIVYQIIREHGGRMEVTSKPNVGTTFTVILPMRTEKLGLPEPAKRSK